MSSIHCLAEDKAESSASRGICECVFAWKDGESGADEVDATLSLAIILEAGAELLLLDGAGYACELGNISVCA